MNLNPPIEQIKANLPSVKIQIPNAGIYDGKTTGRNCHYATVFVTVDGTLTFFELAWKQIQQSVKTGNPIRV